MISESIAYCGYLLCCCMLDSGNKSAEFKYLYIYIYLCDVAVLLVDCIMLMGCIYLLQLVYETVVSFEDRCVPCCLWHSMLCAMTCVHVRMCTWLLL